MLLNLRDARTVKILFAITSRLSLSLTAEYMAARLVALKSSVRLANRFPTILYANITGWPQTIPLFLRGKIRRIR
jgi:hypothetical protein